MRNFTKQPEACLLCIWISSMNLIRSQWTCLSNCWGGWSVSWSWPSSTCVHTPDTGHRLVLITVQWMYTQLVSIKNPCVNAYCRVHEPGEFDQTVMVDHDPAAVIVITTPTQQTLNTGSWSPLITNFSKLLNIIRGTPDSSDSVLRSW